MPRGTSPIYTIVLPTGAEVAKAAKAWLVTCGPWWASSVTVHAVAIYGAILVMGPYHEVARISPGPKFDTEIKEQPREPDDPPIQNFAVGETPPEPADLTTETLSLIEPPEIAEEEQINTTPDDPFVESGGGLLSPDNSAIGAMAGVRAKGPGARMSDVRGVMTVAAPGLDNEMGSGGKGTGFRERGQGIRQHMVGGYGGTKNSERAVGAALNWLSRHQNPDGGWSLDRYTRSCQDGSCSGVGTLASDNAATALALLPFLGAGQTHQSRGPYRGAIEKGVKLLLKSQKTDGDLRGPGGTMYVHGLGAIVLCEAYGMSGDSALREPAQRAIHFIEKSQDTKGGGWRYSPGEPGDMSVVGWQVMALKSAIMAGLTVDSKTVTGIHMFLDSSSAGNHGGLFAYMKPAAPTITMTSVGLLSTQYLGARRNDPRVVEGVSALMQNLPDGNTRNCYYWYYATLAMHNLPGPEWDTWNRRMRKILIDSQVRYGCAAGSWSPQGHAHSEPGGRIMVTSLSALTLEVYYRYLPIYRAGAD